MLRPDLADRLVLGTSITVVGGVALFGAPGGELAAVGALALAYVAMLRFGPRVGQRLGEALRFFLVLAWFYLVHRGAGVILAAAAPSTHERRLSSWDHAVFGGDLSEILEVTAHPIVTEVVQLGYSSLYEAVIVVPAYLIAVRRIDDARSVIRSLVILHAAVIATNCLLPAKWPLLIAEDPAFGDLIRYETDLVGLWLTPWLSAAVTQGTVMQFDSFPSGHTALSLLMTLAAWRHAPRLLWFIGPVAALTVFGTVYLRYHYGVDVIAGALFAAVVWWWQGSRPTRSAGRAG